MKQRNLHRLVWPVWMAVFMAGCTLGRSPQGISFESADPSDRIIAVRRAGQAKDRSAIPALVDRLEDEDDGVRFYTILALEKIAGTRLGYNYADGEVERVRAANRWREFVRSGAYLSGQSKAEATTEAEDGS